MKNRSFPLLGVILLAAGLFSCARRSPAAADQPARPEPSPPGPVVIAVVIDQLSAWAADERLPLFPGDGGFARLRREGLWVKEMHFQHAATDTAPGHAAIFTACTPRESGIVANEIWREDWRRSVAIVLDEQAALVNDQGVIRKDGEPVPGSSARTLLCPAVADQLRRVRPDARVIALSLKDRGAAFAAGNGPAHAIWFDYNQGGAVSSTQWARDSRLPAFAMEVLRKYPLDSWLRIAWSPLPGNNLKQLSGIADDAPGEGDFPAFGKVFPHLPEATGKSLAVFRATPASDDLLLELARAALNEPRESPLSPVFLSLSLSAHDYTGHLFGPNSWEAWDMLFRLDQSLGRFMEFLDGKFGPEGWSMVLTGDHGVSPMPEAFDAGAPPWCGDKPDRWRRPCERGGRIQAKHLAGALNQELAKDFPNTTPAVQTIVDPWLYLSPQVRGMEPGGRSLLMDALIRRLERTPGVEAVFLPGDFSGDCPDLEDESVRALVCRSTSPGRGGDLYLVTRPGWYFDPELVENHGASHGTPWLYDRAVPLLARAPGRVFKGVMDEPRHFGSAARTLADLLGAPPTPAMERFKSFAAASTPASLRP
ncbi:MAG: Calcium-transporting ATPase [Myxococcota bacterium]|nr:Calcium-transporting ATPase [Myxococcota bacterium]